MLMAGKEACGQGVWLQMVDIERRKSGVSTAAPMTMEVNECACRVGECLILDDSASQYVQHERVTENAKPCVCWAAAGPRI